MPDVISNIGSWISALLGWIFGTAGTSSTSGTPGIFSSIINEPILVAVIIGVPLSIALVRFVVGLIRGAVGSAT